MESKEGGGKNELKKNMKERRKNKISDTETRKEIEIIQGKEQDEMNIRKKTR
jgi:hypothetical protein